jgi:hypothetical protein
MGAKAEAFPYCARSMALQSGQLGGDISVAKSEMHPVLLSTWLLL